MKKVSILKLIAILGVIGFSLYNCIPLNKKINLGLDLKGGMHLIFRVDTSKLSNKEKKGAQERALEILRNRIDQLGVAEPVIQPQGENQIVIQLPGVTNRKRALNIIGQTALLEFKLVEEDPDLLKQAFTGKIPEGYELKPYKDGKLLLKKEASLTGKYITDAQVKIDENMQPYVAVEFNSKGAKIFSKVTTENVGRRLAIVLDGKIKSAPVIREPITNGRASITGYFTPQEANDLCIVLKAGALPCPLVLEEERTVGPLLGKDSIQRGIKASIIASIVVGLFMIIYYSIAGVVSVLGLSLVLLIILGVMGYLGSLPQVRATLTLPGIAGIVLTLGMAVDANVLIFERIREEVETGKTLLFSIKNGFSKAFSAIFDSNITTLIAAFFLFQFGTGPIRGFALTLSIGLLASMFSALVFSRFVLESLASFKIIKSIPMLHIFRKRNWDFLKLKNVCFLISGLIIIGGLILFFTKTGIYGIDFAGGQILEYKFDTPPSLDKLRNLISNSGIKEFSLQQFREDPRVILIKTKEDYSQPIESLLNREFKNKFHFLRQESVGPAVSSQLKKKALKAILFALGGILIYVGFRFKHLSFGIAGVVALFHDVLVTLSFLLFTGRVIDLLIITAFLTIAGYSINDTIVIYDRIREIFPSLRRKPLSLIINTAINQTLSRTIITSLTTIFVVIVLYFLGGQVLNDFSFALMIGFIAGTYSTIFIASPIVILLQRKSL